MSGFIVHSFGFKGMLYTISFIGLCYAPLMLFLRNPPAKDEKMVSQSSIISSRILTIVVCFFLVFDYERKS